jgi:tetratricopeptide (TPR) repeat protein
MAQGCILRQWEKRGPAFAIAPGADLWLHLRNQAPNQNTNMKKLQYCILKNTKPVMDFAQAASRLALGLLVIAVWLFNATPIAQAEVRAYRGQIAIPTYPWWPPVKHPYFRGTDGRNIYPYPMLDNLKRTKEPRTYRTVVLENEYLRLTFLPELGGRVHEVIDKTTSQPMFYVNHVIKPGLIGQCGAWISGGIEWNTGPQGHTVSCIQPVDVVILPPEKDGSRSVAVGETERIYGTKWTVVVTLRPGRSFIEERIRIYNPTEHVRPYYFWNCTAVPNTKGFRFIYPMTLGTDHGAERFFNWPIHEGKDLSRGTNYQDASSIFAWYCDQDFFGSYNDDLDRGIVAYANHHQLPGKKAWTWGQGGFGKMHQIDLTDDDGPYNEVQTGPLLTQGEVGRLDPCEAVEWQEWWYPVHGIGGFTFANKNVAANASVENGKLRLRLIGSGSWRHARIGVCRGDQAVAEGTCDIEPFKPADVELAVREATAPFEISILSEQGVTLANWRFPLDLPARKPPERRASTETISELVQAGWQEFLFARFSEAERRFGKALEKDPKCLDALVGLANLRLDGNPAKAAEEARAAVAIDPNYGAAQYALAVAESRLDHHTSALDAAWKATLDPATAIAGRALVAKLLIRQRRLDDTVEALAAPGPWQNDSVCRHRLALALHERRDQRQARALMRECLEVDPLDTFAQSIHWLDLSEKMRQTQAGLLRDNLNELLEVVAEYNALGRREVIYLLLDGLHVHRPAARQGPARSRNLLADYWYLDVSVPRQSGCDALAKAFGVKSDVAPRSESVADNWPYQYEALRVLQRAVELDPKDGQAALLLGHLLFHLGRHAEGREMWKRAAQANVEPVIAYRALGMATLTLDNDAETAAKYLAQANQADRTDSIVARDLARLLFTQADKADSPDRKRELWTRVSDTLKAAFDKGKGRSDFVALLARAQNRLGAFAETATLLDSVRITIWEGAREAHDLFEEAHLALGEAHLKADRAAEALAEFNRALEYPPNLATGKLENAREAHIHYLRGNAMAVLGREQAAIEAWKKAADEPPSRDTKKEEARKKAKAALEKRLKKTQTTTTE